VDLRDGRIGGQATHEYAHGVIDRELPAGGGKLPPDYALQHPQDGSRAWPLSATQSLANAKATAVEVIGIGVDFTSCTMLPAFADGTPLCILPSLPTSRSPGQSSGSITAPRRKQIGFNQIARERNEPWLARYGGVIGLEWFFPKVLETLTHERKSTPPPMSGLRPAIWLGVAAHRWTFPHCQPSHLIRSTCQAGYKAMWNGNSGYPQADYFGRRASANGRRRHGTHAGTIACAGTTPGTLTNAAPRSSD